VSGGRWSATSGPPLANAACRVFPKQAILEIEGPVGATQPCGSQAGPPGQPPQSLPARLKLESPRKLVNLSCRTLASFPRRRRGSC
jgi:hypothetical protein